MKTEQLIAALAADPRARPPVARALWLGLLPAGLVALGVYAVVLGPRADLLAAVATPRFVLKVALSALLLILATFALTRVASPGRPSRGPVRALWLVPCLLAIAVVVELLLIQPNEWATYWIGHNATWCLRAIPALGLAPLVASLLVLRHAAPTRPMLAGSVAGLVAGGFGATLYATHCPDDSPLFIASWYALAILLLTGLGALIGRRMLRW